MNLSFFRATDAEEAYHDLVMDSHGEESITKLLLAKPLAVGDKRADIMIRFAFITDVKKVSQINILNFFFFTVTNAIYNRKEQDKIVGTI